MQRVSLEVVLGSIWIAAVSIAGLAGELDSMTRWAVVAGLALSPPIVMMWRRNTLAQTMSESIQEARR
jgi:hypothetical protein